MILLLQPLRRKFDKSKSGTTVARRSIDQQPKRKGISKEPDRATSESGEAKLLDAVAMLTSNLRVREKNHSCVQDTDSELAGTLRESIEACTIEGQYARDAAKNKGEQYQGHPQGKRTDALLRLLLWRVALMKR